MKIILLATGFMTLYGTLGGFVFGILYGIVYTFVWLLPVRDPGILLVSLVGAFPGVILGILIGFIIGMVSGLVVGGITRFFFFPLIDPLTYRWTLSIVYPSLVASGTWVCLSTLVPNDLYLTSIPALFSAVPAYFAAQQFANEYEYFSKQRKNEEKPKHQVAYD